MHLPGMPTGKRHRPDNCATCSLQEFRFPEGAGVDRTLLRYCRRLTVLRTCPTVSEPAARPAPSRGLASPARDTSAPL